jgi:hypothetical protein
MKERHSCGMMNMRADQQARLAAMREQLASIAAQPQMLWLSTAGAETSAPAETISRYSAGESPPIKAGRPVAKAHLATACGGIDIFWET